MKTCNNCGKEKAITEFYKDSSKKEGIKNECKNCTKKKKISTLSGNTTSWRKFRI